MYFYFQSQHCHNKHGSDFVFVGSSSLLATAGQSSEHRNVALWDTLMPQRKSNVVCKYIYLYSNSLFENLGIFVLWIYWDSSFY